MEASLACKRCWRSNFFLHLEKSKDMSIEEKSDFALQRLEEESAARKRYDEMTQIWITDYTKMSEEEKNAFITEYMALRENYSFDKKNDSWNQWDAVTS